MTYEKPKKAARRGHDAVAELVVWLHAVADDVRTLGPVGAIGAVVVWFQGCSLACRNCASVQTWRPEDGRGALVSDVVEWILATGSTHLVFSGGEVGEQARAAAAIVDGVRSKRDAVLTMYSGFTLAELTDEVRDGTAALVERADLLIDGRYVESQHAPLLWRSTTNQQLHDLTGRVAVPADEPAGVMAVISADGTAIDLIGVPEVPGLARTFAVEMARGEVPIALGRRAGRAPTFPFPTFTHQAAHQEDP